MVSRVSRMLHLIKVWRLTLEGAVGSLLDSGLDVVVGGALLQTGSQVDNGDVGSRHTHGHASQLAVKSGDDLADSLGSAGAARDDVLGSSAATTPVLGGGAVDSLLSSSVGVNGGHKTLDDGELVVENLGERSQAVGGARGVGDDIGTAVVGLLVDTHHIHGRIGGGGRDDNLLGASSQMSLGLIDGGENTGRLDDVLSAGLPPGDVGGIPLLVELDGLAVHNEAAAILGDVTLENAVGGVVLQHVGLSRGG